MATARLGRCDHADDAKGTASLTWQIDYHLLMHKYYIKLNCASASERGSLPR